MPDRCSYDYAIIHLVPCIERGEFINAGVILHCSERAFLACRTHLNADRLRALWPDSDAALAQDHLAAYPRICAGDPQAGPIAKLSRRERFHWLVAPRNTIIQVSPVHSGLTETPQATLDELFERLVLK